MVNIEKEAGVTAETIDPADPAYTALNVEYGLSLFRDHEVYVRFLRKFEAQYRPELERISEPAVRSEELASVLHKLRGAAGSLGLEQVAATVSRFETRLKAGDDWQQEVRPLVRSLERAFRAIADYAPPAEETATEAATGDNGAVAGKASGGAG